MRLKIALIGLRCCAVIVLGGAAATAFAQADYELLAIEPRAAASVADTNVLTETNNLMRRFISQQIVGLNNGDPVSTWPEFYGVNATAAGGVRPLYVNDAATNINGYAVVVPDASDDEMAFTETNLTTDATIYCVARRPVTGTKLILTGGASGTSYQWLHTDDVMYMGFSGSAFAANGGPSPTNGVHIWTWSSATVGGVKFYIDMAEFGVGAAHPGGDVLCGKLFVASSVVWGAGHFAEILAYKGTHTGAQRTNVWTYLKNEYGTP